MCFMENVSCILQFIPVKKKHQHQSIHNAVISSNNTGGESPRTYLSDVNSTEHRTHGWDELAGCCGSDTDTRSPAWHTDGVYLAGKSPTGAVATAGPSSHHSSSGFRGSWAFPPRAFTLRAFPQSFICA